MRYLNLLNRYFIEKPEIKAVRRGMVKTIPLLMIGSFALVFRTLPIPIYQQFVSEFASGMMLNLFSVINSATFGMMSVYVTAAIAYCYAQERLSSHLTELILTSLVCFAILTGVLQKGFSVDFFGVKAIFTAIFSSITASRIYIFLEKMSRFNTSFSAEGADMDFNTSLKAILPSFITILFFAVLNYAIVSLFSVSGMHELFTVTANSVFSGINNKLLSGYLFVFISSMLWFFGMHGSNVLEGVMQKQFSGLLSVNQANIKAGAEAAEILAKPFFDSFVLMGGCGTAFSLLFALLIFSKRQNNKSLSKIAAFPMFFNINEIMVFGLPIILNPFMFVPFITVPLISFSLSYAAIHFKLVPVITNDVVWTTPIILSGYIATGSAYGAMLQIVILTIGTLVYWPFVRSYEQNRERSAKKQILDLVEKLKEAEKNHTEIVLINLSSSDGSVAKYLASDLKYAMWKNQIKMHYQPQFNNTGNCVGAEALMRWNHPVFGMIYPPLVIKLAAETGILADFEQYLIRSAMSDLERINSDVGKGTNLCINISAATLQNPSFIAFLRKMNQKHGFKNKSVCFEVTEQMSLMINDKVEAIFTEMNLLGYKLAIDDFAMGSTSLKYLQSGKFDLVKIDGELVKGMLANPRCKDIINSIIQLSETLGFSVLAEYVETESQKKDLESIGCYLYQGYLYSPAVTAENYIKILTPATHQTETGKDIN